MICLRSALRVGGALCQGRCPPSAARRRPKSAVFRLKGLLGGAGDLVSSYVDIQKYRYRYLEGPGT